MDRIERQLSSQQVLSGGFLSVWRDQVRLPDGALAQREYIKHPGAVVVVALVDDDHAVMERQYRYPLHRDMLEFPAGKLEANERGPEGAGAVPGALPGAVPGATAGVWSCAVRELAEETGYRAAHWAYAGAMHNAIAYADEIIHICFCRGLTLGAQNLDAGEFLDVFTACHEQITQDVRESRLTDAKSITALWWWDQLRSGQWTPDWQAIDALPQAAP